MSQKTPLAQPFDLGIIKIFAPFPILFQYVQHSQACSYVQSSLDRCSKIMRQYLNDLTFGLGNAGLASLLGPGEVGNGNDKERVA